MKVPRTFDPGMPRNAWRRRNRLLWVLLRAGSIELI
jgi:hypothetical protein